MAAKITEEGATVLKIKRFYGVLGKGIGSGKGTGVIFITLKQRRPGGSHQGEIREWRT